MASPIRVSASCLSRTPHDGVSPGAPVATRASHCLAVPVPCQEGVPRFPRMIAGCQGHSRRGGSLGCAQLPVGDWLAHLRVPLGVHSGLGRVFQHCPLCLLGAWHGSLGTGARRPLGRCWDWPSLGPSACCEGCISLSWVVEGPDGESWAWAEEPGGAAHVCTVRVGASLLSSAADGGDAHSPGSQHELVRPPRPGLSLQSCPVGCNSHDHI